MSFVSKVFDRNAAKKAGKQEVAAMQASIGANQQNTAENVQRFEPYSQFGQQAIGGINSLMGYGQPQDNGAGVLAALRARPGYQSRLNEGLDQVQQSAAAQGLLASGSTLKAVNDYGQDYASNEYDKELARQYQVLGVGQGAVQSQAGISGQGNQNNIDLITRQGQARANATRASSWGPVVDSAFKWGSKVASAHAGGKGF
jgi:hypothetical protein